MDAEVISRASELIERDNKRFEDVIERLDTNRMEMEKERERAQNLRVEYEQYKSTAEKELKERIEKKEAEINKMALKARQILDSARASSEFIFRQLEELRRDHSGMPHGGSVIRGGHTGLAGENRHTVEFSLKLDSNPEFTASVLVAYARAIVRMHAEGKIGAVSVFDIPPAMLSPMTREQMLAKML